MPGEGSRRPEKGTGGPGGECSGLRDVTVWPGRVWKYMLLWAIGLTKEEWRSRRAMSWEGTRWPREWTCGVEVTEGVSTCTSRVVIWRARRGNWRVSDGHGWPGEVVKSGNIVENSCFPAFAQG